MPAEANEFISLEIQDSIAILTLDRPPLNVLHIPMLEQLESVLASLAGKDTLRVMILEARGEMCWAGGGGGDPTGASRPPRRRAPPRVGGAASRRRYAFHRPQPDGPRGAQLGIGQRAG